MKKYIESLQFGIKDLKLSTKKYKSYQSEIFGNLMKTNHCIVSAHLQELKENITGNFYRGSRSHFYYNLDFDNKSDIKTLKNNVNFATYDINKELIMSLLTKPNENKIRCFTIKFYLKYYDKINQIMKQAFLDLCERGD